MRRSVPTMIALVASLLLLSLAAPGVAAQGDLTADHLAVGTWVMDDASVVVIHGDGTASSTHPDGRAAFGAWTPTGRRAIVITLAYVTPGGPGVPGGQAIKRATARLSGENFALDIVATIEVQTPDGGTTGQLGPIESLSERDSSPSLPVSL